MKLIPIVAVWCVALFWRNLSPKLAATYCCEITNRGPPGSQANDDSIPSIGSTNATSHLPLKAGLPGMGKSM